VLAAGAPQRCGARPLGSRLHMLTPPAAAAAALAALAASQTSRAFTHGRTTGCRGVAVRRVLDNDGGRRRSRSSLLAATFEVGDQVRLNDHGCRVADEYDWGSEALAPGVVGTVVAGGTDPRVRGRMGQVDQYNGDELEKIAGDHHTVAEGVEDYSQWSAAALVDLLPERGCSTSLTKGELIRRLTVLDAAVVESNSLHDATSAVDDGLQLEDNSTDTLDADQLKPGDTICLRAHTGRYLAIFGEEVRAINCSCKEPAQRLIMEKSPLVVESTDSSTFHSGDMVFLKAHTGTYVDVQDSGRPVMARWKDLGTWQGLIITKPKGLTTGPICSGDTIFLQAHTGTFVDVQDDAVRARWPDEGDWQMLVIDRGD